MATIIDRLETDNFEIAVFGRVSSGKSSLLNQHCRAGCASGGRDPHHGRTDAPGLRRRTRATAWFADRKPEKFSVERLGEFRHRAA